MQQLLCLQAEDSRAFRWDEDIVLWALTLQYHGGKLVIDRIRGKANEGLGSHGHLEVDLRNWNLFLPSSSTLRSYFPHVDAYAGVSEETIMEIRSAVAAKSSSRVVTGGISFDEMEIRGIGLLQVNRTAFWQGRGAFVGKGFSQSQLAHLSSIPRNACPSILFHFHRREALLSSWLSSLGLPHRKISFPDGKQN